MATFKKGHSKRGGRTKGTPNKVSRTVKEALLDAGNDGKGLKAFFLRLKNGSASDRRCFAQVLTKLLPQELTGEGGGPIELLVKRY